MAASTITRDTWTNDTGTAANPNGDGTILANTVLQNHIYARIDAMFAGSGSYTTFTLGGLFSAEGFGTHTLSAGGSGSNALSVRNTSAGTTNRADIKLGNNSNAALTELSSFSSTYTTTNATDGANTSAIYAAGAGGLSIAAYDAAGVIRFHTGGFSEVARIHASGGVSIGNTTDPLAGVLNAATKVYAGYDLVSAYAELAPTRLTLYAAGAVSTSYLDLTGGLSLGSSGQISISSANGYIQATYATTASAANTTVADGVAIKRSTSVRSAKHTIRPIALDDAMRTVMGLQAVLYQSKVDDDQRNWPGFIAEDVEQVNPTLATYGPQGDLQSVAYDRFSAYLMPVAQDHETRLRALEAKLS